MYEKTNCVLMVQRYKHCPSTTNLFSEPPIFFNKNRLENAHQGMFLL